MVNLTRWQHDPPIRKDDEHTDDSRGAQKAHRRRFFLLDDLIVVENSRSSVKFFLPFTNFDSIEPLPRNIDEFRLYIKAVEEFIKKRNERIKSVKII